MEHNIGKQDSVTKIDNKRWLLKSEYIKYFRVKRFLLTLNESKYYWTNIMKKAIVEFYMQRYLKHIWGDVYGLAQGIREDIHK